MQLMSAFLFHHVSATDGACHTVPIKCQTPQTLNIGSSSPYRALFERAESSARLLLCRIVATAMARFAPRAHRARVRCRPRASPDEEPRRRRTYTTAQTMLICGPGPAADSA